MICSSLNKLFFTIDSFGPKSGAESNPSFLSIYGKQTTGINSTLQEGFTFSKELYA
jgi:hypothetical protein